MDDADPIPGEETVCGGAVAVQCVEHDPACGGALHGDTQEDETFAVDVALARAAGSGVDEIEGDFQMGHRLVGGGAGLLVLGLLGGLFL